MVAVVFDSSTLILLARAELLDAFLEDYQGPVLIPAAVEAECVGWVSYPGAVLIRERIRVRRIRVRKVRKMKAIQKLMADFQLGRGEAEALVLAQTERAELVASDDRNAIRACKLLRLPFTTAMAFLLRAAAKGLMTPEAVRASFRRLATFGRYKAAIVEDVERRLGELRHGKNTKNA